MRRGAWVYRRQAADTRPLTTPLFVIPEYGSCMVWGWFLRRQARIAWARLSARQLDDLPLAANMRFTWDGDPDLAVELHSANELRSWLRDQLFAKYPRLRFEIDDIVACGPPWHVRAATRYRAMQDDEVAYHGIQLTRIRLGKVVEERIVTASNTNPAITSETSSESGSRT